MRWRKASLGIGVSCKECKSNQNLEEENASRIAKQCPPPNIDRGPLQVLPPEATEPIHFAIVELQFIQTDLFLCNDVFTVLLGFLPSQKPSLKQKPHLHLGGKMASWAFVRLRNLLWGPSVRFPAKSSLSNKVTFARTPPLTPDWAPHPTTPRWRLIALSAFIKNPGGLV